MLRFLFFVGVSGILFWCVVHCSDVVVWNTVVVVEDNTLIF